MRCEFREVREFREFREIREFSDFLNSLNSLNSLYSLYSPNPLLEKGGLVATLRVREQRVCEADAPHRLTQNSAFEYHCVFG